jgi:phosphoglycolate phosphatase
MNYGKFRVKGIILDLDGTLVDSREAYLDAATKAFSAFGKELPNGQVAFEIPKRFELGLPLDNIIQGIKVESFRTVYLKAYYAATTTRSRPFPGVVETLEKLSRKANLALTTRRQVPKNEIVRQMAELGLGKYLDTIVTGMDTPNPKPSPEPLLKCAREMALAITDCLVVGDSVIDIAAGKSAGTKTVAVLSGIFSMRELRSTDPDLILENVTELPYYLT